MTGCRSPCSAPGAGSSGACGGIDAFLFIGSGEFHPMRLALDSDKPVYAYNPYSKELRSIGKDDVDAYKRKVRGRLLRFHHAKTVGLLVTTKPGQNNGVISRYSLKAKMSLPLRWLKKKDKKYYLFAVETLQHNSLEDFPFIDCWVNFACNRIADDGNMKIVNVQDIEDD